MNMMRKKERHTLMRDRVGVLMAGPPSREWAAHDTHRERERERERERHSHSLHPARHGHAQTGARHLSRLEGGRVHADMGSRAAGLTARVPIAHGAQQSPRLRLLLLRKRKSSQRPRHQRTALRCTASAQPSSSPSASWQNQSAAVVVDVPRSFAYRIWSDRPGLTRFMVRFMVHALRERERKRQRERGRERETERQRDRGRERETERLSARLNAPSAVHGDGFCILVMHFVIPSPLSPLVFVLCPRFRRMSVPSRPVCRVAAIA